jgi:hypothetical protein
MCKAVSLILSLLFRLYRDCGAGIHFLRGIRVLTPRRGAGSERPAGAEPGEHARPLHLQDCRRRLITRLRGCFCRQQRLPELEVHPDRARAAVAACENLPHALLRLVTCFERVPPSAHVRRLVEPDRGVELLPLLLGGDERLSRLLKLHLREGLLVRDKTPAVDSANADGLNLVGIRCCEIQ